MQSDPFYDRLAAVRKRFASSLAGRIDDTRAELPRLAGTGADVTETVAACYRRIHGICGIAAAVGFPLSGGAAKDVEDVLVGAFRGRRGLTAQEATRLDEVLATLSAVARAELESSDTPLVGTSEG